MESSSLKMLIQIVVLLLLSSCANAPRKSINLENEITIEKIQDGVFVATDTAFYNSNVLITKMNDRTVVIASSPFDNLGSQTLVNWIKLNLNPKKIVAINTHFHRDGTGGNLIYKQEGIEVWSSDLTKDLVQREINKTPKDLSFYKREDQKKRIQKSNLVQADNIFKLKKGKIFNFSGEKVHVFYPGHAHSPDNVVVYFPNKKILFGGCMIKPKTLGYTGVADIKNWAKATRNLSRFDFDTVVPGHEKWGGPDLVDKTIAVAEKASKAKVK